MKNNFNKHQFQNKMRNFKAMCRQLVVPICVLQTIRTFIFPSTIDVLLTAIFIALALGFHYEWI